MLEKGMKDQKSAHQGFWQKHAALPIGDKGRKKIRRAWR